MASDLECLLSIRVPKGKLLKLSAPKCVHMYYSVHTTAASRNQKMRSKGQGHTVMKKIRSLVASENVL